MFSLPAGLHVIDERHVECIGFIPSKLKSGRVAELAGAQGETDLNGSIFLLAHPTAFKNAETSGRRGDNQP